jgi:hypothetical protein
MEIRNAVLLQRIAAKGERGRELSRDLVTIQRGSWYRVVGELSLADACQHPTLASALEQFGVVDLVLAESYDTIRKEFRLFDDFIDFRIKLAFVDDIMEELYLIDENSLSDPDASDTNGG